MRNLHWTSVVPALAVLVLAATWGSKPPWAVLVVVGVLLAGAVLAAVHHAEVVAYRVGEPFGSLVLAVAVTVIEVALIVTLMVSGGSETSTLARDTVFAATEIRRRDRRDLAAGRRARPGRRVVHRRGVGERARHGLDARDADARAADVHHQRARA
jgi:hypothetical protein